MMTNMTRLLDKRTILLVDSTPSSRQLLTAMFRDHGCRTLHQARSAREAMDLLDVTRGLLDVVVIAVDLAPTSGLALLKAVRSGRTAGLPGVPCVLFHPSPDPALKRVALSLDAALLFGLPVSAHALCTAVGKIAAKPKPVRPPADYAELPVDWTPADVVPAAETAGGQTARQAALFEARQRAEAAEEECAAAALTRTTRLVADLKGASGTILLRAGEVISPKIVARLLERGNLDRQSRIRVQRAEPELDQAS